jgi:1,4-alpha-glucan branching enzyme
MVYAFTENYTLPLSHDEVVYGKASLLSKMPGDNWQKFANLRLLFGYMYAMPGKKLIFMGGEFGQWREWNHDESLEWHLLEYAPHTGLQQWVTDLNLLYRNQPSLYQNDFDPAGFEWIDTGDFRHSIISFIRKGYAAEDTVLAVCNFTPETQFGYEIGVPLPGAWTEILNSDNARYGGSGQVNPGTLTASENGRHGRPYSLTLTVPPLSTIFLKRL